VEGVFFGLDFAENCEGAVAATVQSCSLFLLSGKLATSLDVVLSDLDVQGGLAAKPVGQPASQPARFAARFSGSHPVM
jgi:hypothetical protein